MYLHIKRINKNWFYYFAEWDRSKDALDLVSSITNYKWEVNRSILDGFPILIHRMHFLCENCSRSAAIKKAKELYPAFNPIYTIQSHGAGKARKNSPISANGSRPKKKIIAWKENKKHNKGDI